MGYQKEDYESHQTCLSDLYAKIRGYSFYKSIISSVTYNLLNLSQTLYTGTRNSLFFNRTATIKGRVYPGLPYTY